LTIPNPFKVPVALNNQEITKYLTSNNKTRILEMNSLKIEIKIIQKRISMMLNPIRNRKKKSKNTLIKIGEINLTII
jgi:hypothetical protein